MLPSLPHGTGACGQDVLIAELLNNKKEGTFLDIGANDGITISNTYYLEKELNWNGVAVEPIPSIFAKLQSTRKCGLVNGCIAPSAGVARFIELSGQTNMLSTLANNNSGLTARRIRNNLSRHGSNLKEIEVKCYTFAGIVQEHKLRNIDFLSIDTEGGELEIIKEIDFDRVNVKIISVENNYFDREIRAYLENNGFIYIGNFKVDEIYMYGGDSLRNALRQ